MGYMGNLIITYPKPYSIYLRGTTIGRAIIFLGSYAFNNQKVL